MNIIKISNGSMKEDVRVFKETYRRLSSDYKPSYAIVNYCLSGKKTINTYLDYPLVVYNNGYVFCVRNVSTGTENLQTYGMIECLQTVGFKFDEREILKNYKNVKKTFTKGLIVFCPLYTDNPRLHSPICDARTKCEKCSV